VPAASTVHAVLDRHGLVKRMSRARMRAEGTPLSDGLQPNDLWCTDYKGEFQLGDKRYCYPLTVTDHASRYLLLCEALESNREELALRAFDRLFRERGLPQAIRSDNGVPFASPHGLFQLSKLSVWWLRLGIAIERIRPGHPQQNAYASHCTSFEQSGMTDAAGRRRESFVPCAFLGLSEPTGSYSCSGLSV
jgi:transposase InsO family protein